MTENVTSLLPMNATEIERIIESTISRDLELMTQTLWDPQTCPADLLPWLAWSLSVDQWDAQWPIATQRKVITESANIHRHNGTRKAIVQALASTGLNTQINEWFEHAGQPFTFELTAWVNDDWENRVLLEPRSYSMLYKLIDAAKPVRTHFTLNVGMAFEITIVVSLVARSLVLVQQQWTCI